VAKLLKVHHITVARKVKYLGLEKRWLNSTLRRKRETNKVIEMQFDDLETFEHSKMKPLSVTIALEKDSRFILGYEVSRMPAKGLLAKPSVKKYGIRKDERAAGRDRLFRKIQSVIAEKALVQSDQSPHYPSDVRKYFPNSIHETTAGRRGCVVGQGELKAGGYDPLFTLNHNFAMLRDNIKRLSRRTWCTTKRIQGLCDLIDIYIHYHNTELIA